MKKLLVIIMIQPILLTSTFAAKNEMADWHAYNGYSDFHNFQLKHPQDWKPQIANETLQVFGPKEEIEKYNPKLLLREFESQTLEEVVNFYVDNETSLEVEQDIMFPSSVQKLAAKSLTFKNKDTEKIFKVLLIQRGSLILSFLEPDEEYSEINRSIYDTFKFTDEWMSYLDSTDNFSFLYPQNLESKKAENSLILADKNNPSKAIFEIKTFDEDVDDSIELTEEDNFNYLSSQEILLGDLKAQEVMFSGKSSNKSYIFLEKDGKTFRLTNSSNFILQEILASFSFSVDNGPKISLDSIADLNTEHPNYEAINDLFSRKIISGYEDGTFRPDDNINRAELAKIIVAAQALTQPADLGGCFKDVKDEWFAGYVCYAKDQGWVSGYEDETFKPENNVSRVEAMKIVLLALYDGQINPKGFLKSKKPFDVDLESWYAQYFIFAENSRLLDKAHIKWSGQSYSYYPDENITRKEVAELIYRLMEYF